MEQNSSKERPDSTVLIDHDKEFCHFILKNGKLGLEVGSVGVGVGKASDQVCVFKMDLLIITEHLPGPWCGPGLLGDIGNTVELKSLLS